MLDLENFVYSCIISGDCDGEPMTAGDAAINISEYRKDFPELFSGVTPQLLTKVWNNTLETLHK